ncbi:GIY-YIG nuclease family protein [Alkalihalobacillus sp. LMS6]|uniref:GIY-YIG nuclease family protein n=1 Tax=Bacillaceae TaxID=186817 RepID=UPI000C0705BC|nr:MULTISPECIES: GIY-YIG nuclease family protein [Bacillaceae]UTR06458.1 GIY-YIG nuclease family protein [Alkalihalobacillus sp. LMS6]
MMNVLTLFIVALSILFIYKAVRMLAKRRITQLQMSEWHDLAPLRTRYESKGTHTSYVYFIRESGMQRVKIGKSDNPELRRKELSTGSAHLHEIVHTVKSENAFKTENLFHKHFDSKRCKGEWFDLTELELNWIKGERYPRNIKDSIRGY